jgi:hypothetical protein
MKIWRSPVARRLDFLDDLSHWRGLMDRREVVDLFFMPQSSQYLERSG